jgi:hypothetical protein
MEQEKKGEKDRSVAVDGKEKKVPRVGMKKIHCQKWDP